MSEHEQDGERFEQELRAEFHALRAAERAGTPAFAAMIARAAEGVPAERGPAEPVRVPTRTPRWRSAQTLAWATPLCVAAGLAIMVFSPARLEQRATAQAAERAAEQAAEREFEAVVGEWTRTTTQGRRLPTDGLLSLPGSEYLRTLPAIGGGGNVSDTRRPS